jgi:hypothetical protein
VIQPPPPPAPERVSTAGTWLGVGVAVRGAAGAVAHFAPLVAVSGVPLLVELIDRKARAQEVPPEFLRVTDLWLELTTILGPYARAAGGSGVLLGLLLFVASAFLVRGSEAGRRATRLLLVASAVHTVFATVWLSSIALGPMAEWMPRYVKAISDLQGAWPGIEDRFPVAFADSGWPSVAVYLVVSLASLALDGLLIWLAGRAFAREWCAARSRRTRVATEDPRR